MSFDPNRHREASLQAWEEAAPGWVSRQELMREFGAPVSAWIVGELALKPGDRVLELAAGLGETALAAAELVAPSGSVIVSDQAEAMLAGARRRAAGLGIENVEFQVLNAEWIDLPVASVDAIACRWGYMLMADPAAALVESRRVLRPGGRIALAVWDAIARNPWALLPALELSERGLGEPPEAARERPGPFALGSEERLRELLEGAGFDDVLVSAIDLERRHESFEELWESTLDLSRSFHDAVFARPEGEIAEIRASLAARFSAHAGADGSLSIPGRTLIASASA